jgi:hypothetical protein
MNVPVAVPAATKCAAAIPCCQFSTTSSFVLPGLRKLTSNHVSGVGFWPKNVAIKLPPISTAAGSKLMPLMLGRPRSNSSLLVKKPKRPSWPPATKTLPLGSSVAV